MSILPYHNRRGQSSLEFIAMVGLALVLFAGFFTFFAGRQATAVAIENQRLAVSTAEEVAFELDLALTQGDGFSRVFDLPADVAGEEYTVSLAGDRVRVRYKDRDILAYTAAEDVNGDIQPGTNKVENRGGVLYVTQP